jgi:hypothetical protein
VVSATPRSLYPRERDPVPIVQVAPWIPGPVRTGTENLVPQPGFDTTTVQHVASRYSDYAIPAPFYELYRTSNKCLVKSDSELSCYFRGAIMICCVQYFGLYSNKGNCSTLTRVKYGERNILRAAYAILVERTENKVFKGRVGIR